MSGDGYKRTHESDCTKRKKKEKRDLYISKQIKSMDKFVITQNRSNAGTSTNQIEISNKNELINVMTPESKTENKLLVLSPKKTEPNSTTSLNANTSVITESIPDKVKSNLTNLSDLKFSNDPAHWDINSDLISYFSENIPIQNVDVDLTVSARHFGKKTRYFRKEYFSRTLGNGKNVNRDWLIYSPSTGSVYCLLFVCL